MRARGAAVGESALYDAALAALAGPAFPSRANHHFAPQTLLCRTDRIDYDLVAWMGGAPPAAAAAPLAGSREDGGAASESTEAAEEAGGGPLSAVLRLFGLDRLPPSELEPLLRLRLNRRPAARRQREPPSEAQRCRFRQLYRADLRALCESET